MKIFKELKKLGYIHYSVTTIEELDDLPLNSAERISEQALVLRWFREKYNMHISVCHSVNGKFDCWTNDGNLLENGKYCDFNTYEEAELECLKKLIEIVKNNNK